MCLSVPQIAAAATRMRISSGAGFGTGQSRTAVPSAPSRGADLTTAFIRRKRRRMLSQRLRRQPAAAEKTPERSKNGVDDYVRRTFRLERNRSRVVRQTGGEAIDRPDQRVAIAYVQILVQSSVHDLDPL